MKITHVLLLVLSILAIGEKPSHAFYLAYGKEGCPSRNDFDFSCDVWITSTTTFGPLATLASGEIDLKSDEAREFIFSQADRILNSQENTINESENLVHVLALQNGVSDENMAQALKSLEVSGSEITEETIRQRLK